MHQPLQDNVSVAQLNFEDAMRELEALVRRLEEGQMSLEDMIAACERGTFLKAHCEKKLKEGQARIEQIIVDSSGVPSTQPMENV